MIPVDDCLEAFADKMIATVARQLHGRAVMLGQPGEKPTMLSLKCCSSSRGVVHLLNISNKQPREQSNDLIENLRGEMAGAARRSQRLTGSHAHTTGPAMPSLLPIVGVSRFIFRAPSGAGRRYPRGHLAKGGGGGQAVFVRDPSVSRSLFPEGR